MALDARLARASAKASLRHRLQPDARRLRLAVRDPPLRAGPRGRARAATRRPVDLLPASAARRRRCRRAPRTPTGRRWMRRAARPDVEADDVPAAVDRAGTRLRDQPASTSDGDQRAPPSPLSTAADLVSAARLKRGLPRLIPVRPADAGRRRRARELDRHRRERRCERPAGGRARSRASAAGSPVPYAPVWWRPRPVARTRHTCRRDVNARTALGVAGRRLHAAGRRAPSATGLTVDRVAVRSTRPRRRSRPRSADVDSTGSRGRTGRASAARGRRPATGRSRCRRLWSDAELRGHWSRPLHRGQRQRGRGSDDVPRTRAPAHQPQHRLPVRRSFPIATAERQRRLRNGSDAVRRLPRMTHDRATSPSPRSSRPSRARARGHRRDEVRRHLGRRRRAAEGRRRAGSSRRARRATASSPCSRRWATRPTSCSTSRTRSRRGRSRARSTCSSRSASGSRARWPRWRSRTSATRRSRSRAPRPGS